MTAVQLILAWPCAGLSQEDWCMNNTTKTASCTGEKEPIESIFTEGGRRGEGYSCTLCLHLRVVPAPWRDSWPHHHIQSTDLLLAGSSQILVSVKAGVSHTLNGRYTAALWIWELMWSKYTMQVYPTIVCSCRWSAPFHYLEPTLLISTETKSMVDSLPVSSTPRFHWLPFILQEIKYKKLVRG